MRDDSADFSADAGAVSAHSDRVIAALAPGEIHLWLSFYHRLIDPRSYGARSCSAYRELLSSAERERESRFHFPEDRLQYLFARVLLRRTLSRYAPVEPEDWVFRKNGYGRPEIANAQSRLGLSFNLSHTRGLIVLAVARRRALGVDVENIACRRAFIELADRYFAADEAAALKAAPRHLQSYRFFEYWTFKEAYIKARGMGLSLPLDGFSIDYPDDWSVALKIKPELSDSPDNWHLWQWRPAPDYLIALCVERSGAALSRPDVRLCDASRSARHVPTMTRCSRTPS